MQELFDALKDCEKVLLSHPKFTRVHRSYIVNMLQVAELSPARICTFQTEQNIFILRIVLPIETATL